jgi:hypothetical protein
MILRIPWRRPDKDHASFSVMMSAKQFSPRVSLDFDP